MKYFLIEDSELSLFQKRVNDLLNCGWSLYGDTKVIFNPSRGSTKYIQAVVKENE